MPHVSDKNTAQIVKLRFQALRLCKKKEGNYGFCVCVREYLHWVIPEKIHTPSPDGWQTGNSCGRGGLWLWKSGQEGAI